MTYSLFIGVCVSHIWECFSSQNNRTWLVKYELMPKLQSLPMLLRIVESRL